MKSKQGFTIIDAIFTVAIVCMLAAIAIPVIKHVKSGEYTERQRLENPDRAKTITVYANDGAKLKTYQSSGYVNVSRSGCYFLDSLTGRRVNIQGNFIVE